MNSRGAVERKRTTREVGLTMTTATTATMEDKRPGRMLLGTKGTNVDHMTCKASAAVQIQNASE